MGVFLESLFFSIDLSFSLFVKSTCPNYWNFINDKSVSINPSSLYSNFRIYLFLSLVVKYKINGCKVKYNLPVPIFFIIFFLSVYLFKFLKSLYPFIFYAGKD